MSRSAQPVVLARRGRSGSVIIAVLWMMGLLSVLTGAMSVYMANTLTVIGVYRDRVRVEAVTRAGIELAVFQFRATPPTGAVQGGASASVGNARVDVNWLGESARIDLNRAKKELLTGLFTTLGARSGNAEAFADGIIEWRTPLKSDDASGPTLAARSTGWSVTPRHGPFPNVAELGMIPGLPDDLVERAKPFLTVYSNVGEIDARIAPAGILAALPGMTPATVQTIVSLRERDPANTQKWSAALGQAQSFVTNEPGKSMRLRIQSDLGNGVRGTSEVVVAIYDDDSEPYRVLSWEDDVGPQAPAKAVSGARLK